MKSRKYLALATTFISLICIVITVYSYIYNTRLDKQIQQRDELISELRTKQDLSRIDTVEIKTSSTITLNGKEITTSELIRYTNSLHKELDMLEDSLRYYKAFYNLSKRSHNSSFEKNIKEDGIEYVYSSKSVDIDSVRTLLSQELNATSSEYIEKYNSLVKDYNELKNKAGMYEKAIYKYGIQFQDVKESEGSVTYYIVAPQVDSALMLLPHYRKQLKFDEKRQQWSIGIKKWF